MTETEARTLIDGLDLTYVIDEAVEEAKEDGKPALVAADASRCYRDFLYVCWFALKHEGADELPAVCECADPVWHQHILVTPQYRRDCQAIFGEGAYLDHAPSDWFKPPREPSQRQREQVKALYKRAGVNFCDHQRGMCVWLKAVR